MGGIAFDGGADASVTDFFCNTFRQHEEYDMRNVALVFTLVFSGMAVLSAESSLASIFAGHGVSGSIAIYDMKNARWTFSDVADADKGSLPASTFKICNSLIALEEKVISPADVIKWDGKDKTFKGKSVKSWNADTNLESAFKNSTIWFYVELSKRINRATYAKYLKACDYGNLDLGEKGDDFWNYGDMEMSPKNQVEFLVKLYNEELPFSKENMKLVKSYMRMNSDGAYALSGKSGWGMKGGKDIGWLIGYLENDTGSYAYATRITADSNKVPNDFGKLRTTITLEAFRQLKIIK